MRIAINGFGRIGRLVTRAALESKEFTIVAINDPSPPETLAHLLNYDSAHGTWQHEAQYSDGALHIGSTDIALSHERDPSQLPWQNLDVDMIFECSGFFASKDKAQAFLAFAQKVLISAPAANADATIVYGVNHQTIQSNMQVISNASCTTNCLAPLTAPLHEKLGIECGLVTTIHAYTNDQRLCDGSHTDLRRARAAATSMIPTKTGAAAAIGLVIPELKGKLDGLAVRVPTNNVSLVDATFTVKQPTSTEEVNTILSTAAQNNLKGILGINTLPLVSCDFNHTTPSSIVDASFTKVSEGHLVKVLSWYDNEWAFCCRMLDTARHWHQI